MGQLDEAYSISTDGTIIRGVQKPKSRKGLIIILIIILLGCIAFIVYGINMTQWASFYAYSLRSNYIYSDWHSTNNNHNSVSYKEYTLALDYDDYLQFEYEVSSEANYDILTITLIYPNGYQKELCKASGSEKQRIDMTIYDGGVYVLIAKYTKDGSKSAGKDMAAIYNLCVYKPRINLIRQYTSWF